MSSNIIDLSLFKGSRPTVAQSDGDDAPTEFRRRRRCGVRRRLLFRSYRLIAESHEADLVRDVQVDTHKARVKLRKIREQIVIDRDKATARDDMMTKAEAKLSAAIEAAQSAPAPAVEVKQPRTSGEALSHRREFREAMRQRIRIVALSLDLSAEQIKPALSLKHHEIANLHQRHGVNLLWLIEGKGRMLMSDPPNSNRNPAELAALVQTLPEAQQRKIEAVVDFLLEELRT